MEEVKKNEKRPALGVVSRNNICILGGKSADDVCEYAIDLVRCVQLCLADADCKSAFYIENNAEVADLTFDGTVHPRKLCMHYAIDMDDSALQVSPSGLGSFVSMSDLGSDSESKLLLESK